MTNRKLKKIELTEEKQELYDKIKDLISKKWTKEQIRAICQK